MWELLTGALLQLTDHLPVSSPAGSTFTVIWLLRLRLIIAQLLLKALLQGRSGRKALLDTEAGAGLQSCPDQVTPSTALRVEGTRNSRNQPRMIHIFIRKSRSLFNSDRISVKCMEDTVPFEGTIKSFKEIKNDKESGRIGLKEACAPQKVP